MRFVLEGIWPLHRIRPELSGNKQTVRLRLADGGRCFLEVVGVRKSKMRDDVLQGVVAFSGESGDRASRGLAVSGCAGRSEAKQT